MPILQLTGSLNSDAKFSSEILNLYVDFLRVTVDKVDSHTLVVPDILSCSITELMSGFPKLIFKIFFHYN